MQGACPCSCILQDTVLTMLEHGKAVLCEKPIGLTGGQAEEMADFAKEMVCACVLTRDSGRALPCNWMSMHISMRAWMHGSDRQLWF
jgi:Oxidoreductase family, NAD-binding Rossmann fold